MPLYDYIYVDLDKVISLYSQLTGGVVELREATSASSRTSDNKRKYDFKVFQHDAGGTKEDTHGLKEVIKPHHSLLSELENGLAEAGYLVDLSTTENAISLRTPALRKKLSEAFCLKVAGRAVVEDYERIKSIALAFPRVAELINRSIETSIKKSPEYAAIKSQIEAAEAAAKMASKSHEGAQTALQLRTLKHSLEELIARASKVGVVDQWILDGLKTWVETFLPGNH